jgi:hypothetical protein
MNCKGDINWRFISEDHSLFLEENRNRKIVVETPYGVIKDTWGRYVEDSYPFKIKMTWREATDVVKKYAYIE